MSRNHLSKSPENVSEKEQILRSKLKLFLTGAKKIVILTIGNEMRRDDGIGIKVFGRLKDLDTLPPSVLLLNTGTTPENFTRPIENWNPSHLLIIDAVDMDEEPGEIELIQMDEIHSITVSTHKMSLTLLNKYLMSKLKLKTKLLGIQIKDVSFGEGLSSELTQVPMRVAQLLSSVLKETTQQLN
jgi:hydrogenase 3 maturation protease